MIMSFWCPGAPALSFTTAKEFLSTDRKLFSTLGGWENHNFFLWICWIGLIHWEQKLPHHPEVLRKMMCSLYPPVAGCATFNSWPSHPLRPWNAVTPTVGRTSLWKTADSPTWKPCRECIAMRWRCNKNQFCWWFVFGFFVLSRKKAKKRQILHHPRKRGNIFPPNREVFGKIIDDSKVQRYMVGDMWLFPGSGPYGVFDGGLW